MIDARTKWLVEVEARFIQRFCINFGDLGWGDSDKDRYFEYGWQPSEFVRWFGEKYDLVERSSAYGLTRFR